MESEATHRIITKELQHAKDVLSEQILQSKILKESNQKNKEMVLNY